MVLRNKEIKKIDKLTKKCDFHGFTSSKVFKLPSSKVFRFDFSLVLASDDIFWYLLDFSARLQFLRKISFYRHQKKKFYD